MRNLLLATICACLVGALTTACGGEDSQPAPGQSSGGPRLAWDQFSSSAEELRRYSFVLFVDGTPMTLTGASCGTLAADTLTAACTAPLPTLAPGQHTLEMATRVIENGVVLESAKSAPVTYTVGSTGFASATAGATAAIPGAGTGSPPGDTGSGTGQATGESQFVVETVVTGLDSPSALARLPDGRLLIAERRGVIRIAEGGILRPEPAAALPDADSAGEARVSLALAPDFAASRYVYACYAAVDAQGGRAGRVVRFREASGTLGELAVIVDGLPAELAAPSILIGPDGALYVATSSGDDGEAADIGSYVGKILRFGLDGTIPPDNPLPSSPVLSFGYRGAVGIDWDWQTGTLWVLETDAEGTDLALAAARRPGTRVAALGPIGPARMAFLPASAAGVPASWRGSLFVAAPDEQCLLRVSGLSASSAAPSVERLLRGEFGRIALVLPAESGLYFATASGVAGGEGKPAGAVFRVRDRSARR